MRWKIADEQPLAAQTAKENGISPITAAVLLNRGISDIRDIRRFLNTSSSDLSDTSLIPDYKKGMDIILDSINNNEKIYIYGDYDVDGVMSTVILYKAFKGLGADVCFYVPHRVYDGYGLNSSALEKIADEGCRLLVTCDNGIAALKEIELAKTLGMKTVILDHHEPVIAEGGETLPDADAVIDCKRGDSAFPFRDMCAGGLCYRFAADLYAKAGKRFSLNRELITLAGIATVCDIVSLRGDNRIIVKNSLFLLNKGVNNIGLRYLISMTVAPGKTITPYTLGFMIGPCINAVGRLDTAQDAVELFVTEDAERASLLAETLVQRNKERQEITKSAAERLTAAVDTSLPVQILYDPDIHESVAGIIASRIKENFYRPTLVVTDSGGECKGSGRSVEEYDLHKNLSAFSEYFTKFGGHAMAVGFSLPKENIDILREKVNAACELNVNTMIPSIRLECAAELDDLSIPIAKELSMLEPYGKDNEAPHFFTLNAPLVSVRFVGVEKNIAQLVFLSRSGVQIKGIYFGGAEKIKELLAAQPYTVRLLEEGERAEVDLRCDIAYSVEINHFNNTDSLQLNIKDMR